jgi:hypothetical protein
MEDIKDRYSISADELESRMQKQAKFHDEPLTKAVAVLEEGLLKIMASLGVDITRDDDSIRMQQEFLGIDVNTLDGYPGVFISVSRKGEPVPYAWISDAILKSDGTYHYEIQFFQNNKLEEIGGIKIVGG